MERCGFYKILTNKNIDSRVAHYIIRLARVFINKKGSFNVALAGGKTPLGAYSILSNLQRDWTKINLFLTDERYVPVEDDRSNCKNLKPFFEGINCFDTSLPPDQSALMYSQKLQSLGCLDLVLLGVGKDGHTASLFPNTECRRITREVCVSTSPDGLIRLSLTEEFINLSEKVVFFIKGEDKRDVLKKLLTCEDIPASRIKPRRSVLIFTDLTLF
ncbi:6-phosphogluconolactonase [Hydrogenobacter hydrogenophilus]|uniref:6-phosphogluconolactonase n=1 Tax=Hydrogenobacter hydrogenophilus TaxID=35835 RepID=A0A285NQC6_9AQUI|nr:6-phosphogluconolactonase [Hydrogenobacter hydrogenophilus]SNZ11143.1 6-phosphogluconolactonase [Hydrogenobacter hydrogenophilus]